MTLPVRPHLMWVCDVEREAGIVVPDSENWKRRLRLWHDNGETVTQAARMLKFMVRRKMHEHLMFGALASAAVAAWKALR